MEALKEGKILPPKKPIVPKKEEEEKDEQKHTVPGLTDRPSLVGLSEDEDIFGKEAAPNEEVSLQGYLEQEDFPLNYSDYYNPRERALYQMWRDVNESVPSFLALSLLLYLAHLNQLVFLYSA